jgi:hypothetical protein
VPIDFARVAGLYADPLTRQTDPMIRLFDRLARVLRELQRQIDAADRASRALPLVRFRDGALSVRVLPLPPGMPPLPGPPPTAMPGAERGCGAAFVAGIAWVGTAVQQELLIPGLVGAVLDLVTEIERRTDAVVRLESSMFSIAPGARHVLEIPALAALGAKVAADAGLLRPKPSAVADESGAATPVPPLLELADMIASMTTGVVLVLPVMTTVVAGRVKIISLAARLAVVDHLVEIEGSLLRIHSVVAETMLDVAGYAAVAERWLNPIELMVRIDLLSVVAWLDGITGYLIGGLNAFFAGINDAFGIWVVIAQVFIIIIESVTLIDLMAPVAPLVAALGGMPPSLTIGDIISEGGLQAATAVASTAGVTFRELGRASATMQLIDDARIWFGLAGMMDALAGHSVGMIGAPPVPAMAPVPDIVGKVLTPALETALADWGKAMVVDARNVVGSSLKRGIGLVGGTAAAVDAVVKDSRRGFAGFSVRDAAGRADQFVGSAMGDDIRKERAAAEMRAASKVADPLVEQFLTKGMKAAGDLVPQYVAAMHRFVKRRAGVRHPPTSPHVLARNGRLVRVRSDRVTIRARGRGVDAALAGEVAVAVREQVGVLYVDGRKRVAAAAASPPGGR